MKKHLVAFICFILIISFSLTTFAAEGEIFAYRFQGSGNNATHLFTPVKLKYEDMIGEGVITYAKRIAKELSNMPEGKRCIDLTLVSAKLDDEPECYIWWDLGAEKLRSVVTQLYKELKANDAVIDYVIDDFEGGMSMWGLKKENLAVIIADSRYESEIRPLLVERGFEFSSTGTTELDPILQFTSNDMYQIWNGVMLRRTTDYYNKTMYEPIKQYYPNVKYSNYGFKDSLGLNKIYDTGGHKTYLYGETYKGGTHSSPVLYGGLGAITKPGRQPEGYPHEKFDATSFNTVLYSVVCMQDSITSGDGNAMPWIPLRSASDSDMNNEYYAELIFHLALLGSDPLLLFNPSSENLADDESHLSELLEEINSILGMGKKSTLVTKVTSWDSSYILSGMNADGKSVWRITPDLYVPGVTIENFLSHKEKLIFQIGNQVVIFPEGSKILENNMSGYGYWIEAPYGVKPQEIRVSSIEAPLAPVLTEDNMPSGYKFNTTYTKYVLENGQPQSGNQSKPINPNGSNLVVDNTHWANKALKKAVQDGVIIGSDKGIEPDRNVTYAEFLTMIQRMMSIDISGLPTDKWYTPVYMKALEYGWIDADYSMSSNLNREYAALIVARALKLNTSVDSGEFADMSAVSSEECKKAIKACAAVGIINGYPNGNYEPLNTITRAEAVVILQRALN